jgi:glycosyltransferase involved in cell wall biosynthesis
MQIGLIGRAYRWIGGMVRRRDALTGPVVNKMAGGKMKLFMLGRWLNEPEPDCYVLARHMTAVFGLEIELFLLGENASHDNGCAPPPPCAVGDLAGLRSKVRVLAADGYSAAMCLGVASVDINRVLEQAGFSTIFADGHIPSTGQGEDAGFELSRYAFDLLRRLVPDLKTVSVIVPNFNYATYLDDRLNSIFAQTYPIFEIIVLDDASTDDSLAALARIRDRSGRFFRLVADDRNSGSVFKQWSKGLDLASGELLWIAEADDLAEPRFVESLAAEFAGSALNMAFANSRQVDEKTALLAEDYDFYYRLHLPGLLSDVKLPGLEFLRRFLSVRNAIFNVSSVIFRRRSLELAVQACSADFPLLRVAGDWNVYIELCRQDGSIAYLADPLSVHRRHSASVTLSLDYWRHIAEIIVIHRKISVILATENPDSTQAAYIEELMRQLSLLPFPGKSPGATALLRWLDDLAEHADLLQLALARAPADLIDECLADIPCEYPAARAALMGHRT